ncbi:hypothetical protein ABHN98_19230 [Pseudomonas syringae]
MSKDSGFKKVTLPKVVRVILCDFDLYTHKPDADVSIIKPVFCLMGANGLGKSTFLNTLNFAMTGGVPDPARKFQSAKDYLKDVARIDRTEDYFGGRIKEGARDTASVTVVLEWPAAVVEVERNIFEGRSVKRLIVTDKISGVVRDLTEHSSDGDALCEEYELEVIRQCKLDDFSQFVFLMHFLATFDEGRHLLMWDDEALTNALYLAFGTDPQAAKAADKLKRDMERESSRGRNVRFSARHVADRIKQLMDVLSGRDESDFASEAELKASHERLFELHQQAEGRVRTKQNELRDIDLAWADLSAALTEAQVEYRRVFSARLKTSSTVEHHPIIRSTLSEDRCAICGGNHVISSLQRKLESDHCPLCDSEIERSSAGEDINQLQMLDSEIIKIREQLGEVLRSRKRLNDELSAAEESETQAHETLRVFEEREVLSLAKVESGGSFSAIQQQIDKLERERLEFLAQSKEHYRKRDLFRDELRVYEKQLKAQYEAGALNFVPRFRELAEEFIGLPIDVELEHRTGVNDSGFGLRLRMNDQLRSTPDKLSESQRFFIDIALRMALAEFMSDSPATLLIDTPEGSLDIAYEARAGAMFAKFVDSGNVILMTANLRSSQLVIRLAEIQRLSGMQVVRMTDWTDLSDVQRSEEKLFLAAYDKIDEALGR